MLGTDEIFVHIGNSKYFSQMHLKPVIHQIRVKPDEIEKTAFSTKYDKYKYLVMSMGLCIASVTFRSLINEIFRDCMNHYVVVYLKDLLVTSEEEGIHLEHLKKVLKKGYTTCTLESPSSLFEEKS